MKTFEKIFWKFLKKYCEICGKNILKIFEKIFWKFLKKIFWKFWKKYLVKWVLRGIECSRHRHLKSHLKSHLKTYLKSELKSQLEIHSKSHGNISHIVCELKESENQPSTSFKKLGGGGGWWVHLDYSVSSAPFFLNWVFESWIWSFWAKKSRSRAWQCQRPSWGKDGFWSGSAVTGPS